jgi:hypothetical protein
MGFEPTTASLEGWNSTTELRPPNQDFAAFLSSYRSITIIAEQEPIFFQRPTILGGTIEQLCWWAGKDSNLGSHKAADLQSAPFVHLGTCPPFT